MATEGRYLMVTTPRANWWTTDPKMAMTKPTNGGRQHWLAWLSYLRWRLPAYGSFANSGRNLSWKIVWCRGAPIAHRSRHPHAA